MFKKLIQAIKDQHRAAQDDLSDNPFISDPVAKKTKWTPAKLGGTNIKTSKLIQVNEWRFEIKPTLYLYFFFGIFAVVGAAVVFFCGGQLLGAFDPAPDGTTASVIGCVFGGIFFSMGFFSILFHCKGKRVVIDLNHGALWRDTPRNELLASTPDELRDYHATRDVYAIQLIYERCSGGKNNTPYYSYELNFVFSDASRMNIEDHGNQKAIRNDAQLLAEALRVPIWDMDDPANDDDDGEEEPDGDASDTERDGYDDGSSDDDGTIRFG